MITTEFVMAVLCTPLSGRELLQAEKNNNVMIMRRLEYDKGVNYFTTNVTSEAPIKLMFVFSEQDVIVVATAEDRRKVERRLQEFTPHVYGRAV